MPVSASGDRLARSSSARRISSSQSMSSGVSVTRPSSSACVGAQRLPDGRAAERRSRVAVEAGLRGASGRSPSGSGRSSCADSAIAGAASGVVRQRQHVDAVARPAPARSSVPAKHEPWSISANSVRDVTSRRASVRRSMPIVSRTSQWSLCSIERRVDRQHRGRRRRAVLITHVPMSSSLVRSDQDRVVELARHRERPPRRAGRRWRRRCRAARRRRGASR